MLKSINEIDQKRVEILMNWINNNNIFIHSSIEIGKRNDGFFVYTKTSLKKNTIILKVPKNKILSPKTSELSYILNDPKMTSVISVCIAYMHEKSLGQKSLWYGYLQIMPNKVDIPKLWNHEKNWLKGTEIDYIGGLDTSELEEVYIKQIRPFVRKNKKILNQTMFTYDNFINAISVVRSRVFEIDKFHNLGLVPFADMFNHRATKEHIHFQTFYEVCKYCGSSTYCDHIKHTQNDYYELIENKTINNTNNQIKNIFINNSLKLNNQEKNIQLYDDTCDVIIYNSPHALDELFNTYGMHGNDVLLSRYGFAIPQNKWDRITMSKTLEKNDINLDRLLWWKLYGFNVSYQMGLFRQYFSKEDIENYIINCKNIHNHSTKLCIYCQKNQYSFLQDNLFIAFPSVPSQSLIFFTILLSLSNKYFKNLKKNIVSNHQYILKIIKLQSHFFYTGSIKKLKYQKYKTLLIIHKINKILLNAIISRLKKYNQKLFFNFFTDKNAETDIKNYRKHWAKIVLQNEISILNNTKKKCLNIINKIKVILKQKNIYIIKRKI